MIAARTELMNLKDKLYGLGVANRLEIFLAVDTLGNCTRRDILNALGEDPEMLGAAWQRVWRALGWLVRAGFVTEVAGGPGKANMYLVDKTRWTRFVEQMSQLLD